MRYVVCDMRYANAKKKECKNISSHGGPSIFPNTNANVNANAASGSIHGPIGANANANTHSIEKTGTLAFLRKFVAR